jgi:predicted nucleic acid-binding protein
MILFLDASSLVKLYIDEEGSEGLRSLVADSDAVVVSRISRLELLSSFARRRREGSLDDDRHRAARQAFDADRQAFGTVDVDIDAAEALVDRHPLRALDALQLAALKAVAGKIPVQDLCFGCHDLRLAQAARAEGFDVRPREA